MKRPPFTPFPHPKPVPTTEVNEPPFAFLRVNRTWLKYVLGALHTLLDRAMWSGSETEAQQAMRDAMEILVEVKALMLDQLSVNTDETSSPLIVAGIGDVGNIILNDAITGVGAGCGLNIINVNTTINNQTLIGFRDTYLTAAYAKFGGQSHAHASHYGGLVAYTRQSDGFKLRWFFGINSGFVDSNFGAFGAEPISQPIVTGSRSSGAAYASLLDALDALGWVDDQSTA